MKRILWFMGVIWLSSSLLGMGWDLESERVPIATLSQNILGQVGRASLYEWRKASFIGRYGMGMRVEFNNYQSVSEDLELAFPLVNTLFALTLSRITVSPTSSSVMLDETPFARGGRPSRYQLTPQLQFPLMEGVASQYLSWIPPLQLVLQGAVGVSYQIYPGALGKLPLKAQVGSFLKPKLTQEEVDHLSQQTPHSLLIDRGRIDPLFGLNLQAYHHLGLTLGFSVTYAKSLDANASGLDHALGLLAGVGYGF